MADDKLPQDKIFRIVIQADIQRVWRELTKTDEAQGAVFNAWLHTTGLVPVHPATPGAGSPPPRRGEGPPARVGSRPRASSSHC